MTVKRKNAHSRDHFAQFNDKMYINVRQYGFIMPPRSYCPECNYPETTCICACVSEICCNTKIDILQHPLEQKAAKNTARLARLCIPSINIWVGEHPSSFDSLRDNISNDTTETVVVYQHEEATDISNFCRATSNRIFRLILIDATWRKAYKMWQLNTWLRDYSSIRLSATHNQYRIRKSPSKQALSTIESISQCLHAFEPDIDISPLEYTFEKLQNNFAQFSN